MTGPILDEWIPITTHELFYLLSLAETPENDESRTRLGMAERAENVDMLLAGAATLAVRGLANLSDDPPEPVDQAAVLAWLLSTAHTWVEVGVTVGDIADALLTVTNDEVAAVLVPAKLGIFRFVIVDPGIGVAGAAKAFVESVFDNNPQVAVSVRRISAAGERSAGASLSRGLWRMVTTLPEMQVGLEPVPRACTRAEVFSELANVIG